MLGIVFAICMMGVGLILVMKVAREGFERSPHGQTDSRQPG
ncbi:MAG: hypothetical protein WDN45_09925 [Caulobacteraceae bacterium]